MLRDLGRVLDNGARSRRDGERDPSDSVFVVVLAEEVNTGDGGAVVSWNVGSVWLTHGEAMGAAKRYQTEGHKAHHGWQFIRVIEYQTGQLAPQAERHGDDMPFAPEGAIGPTTDDKIAELELEIARLRGAAGQSMTVG
jgi:hypothetical protein